MDVPLDTIAERAGVGPGTLHRHFASKAALVTTVIADRLDRLTDRAGGPDALDHDRHVAQPHRRFHRRIRRIVLRGRAGRRLRSASGDLPK
ncbi:TetR/AcrR family transcriptional regulator [Brevibacterium sp. Mu109]|uniref:TetR/AcrR family transcriptional regulator n=1 Tax=Brevibacterium sp. Mu109 TaxID=1255669 RepID=UPI0035B53513